MFYFENSVENKSYLSNSRHRTVKFEVQGDFSNLIPKRPLFIYQLQPSEAPPTQGIDFGAEVW